MGSNRQIFWSISKKRNCWYEEYKKNTNLQLKITLQKAIVLSSWTELRRWISWKHYEIANNNGVGQKSKLLVISEYVNKTEKIWTNKNSYRENEVLSDIFTWNIFYVTVVLCLNILWLKAISEITARQTRTFLCKYDVIKVCSIEYLTTQIDVSVTNFLSTPGLFTNDRIFNVRAIV